MVSIVRKIRKLGNVLSQSLELRKSPVSFKRPIGKHPIVEEDQRQSDVQKVFGIQSFYQATFWFTHTPRQEPKTFLVSYNLKSNKALL